MKTNKISSQKFGQIYFESKDLEQKIHSKIEDLPYQRKNKLNGLIFRNMHSNKYDILVKNNGNVFVVNNHTGKQTEVIGLVSVFTKFQVALGFARVNEIKDEYNQKQ